MFSPSIIMRAIKSLPKTGWFNLMTATGLDYYTDVKLDTQPGGATASSILTKYPASLPIGTFGGRAFSVPSAAYTLTTGTLVQSASTLVESASSAVVQNATWMVAAYKTIPTAKTVF